MNHNQNNRIKRKIISELLPRYRLKPTIYMIYIICKHNFWFEISSSTRTQPPATRTNGQSRSGAATVFRRCGAKLRKNAAVWTIHFIWCIQSMYSSIDVSARVSYRGRWTQRCPRGLGRIGEGLRSGDHGLERCRKWGGRRVLSLPCINVPVLKLCLFFIE